MIAIIESIPIRAYDDARSTTCSFEPQYTAAKLAPAA
jgi:hypothetical protein